MSRRDHDRDPDSLRDAMRTDNMPPKAWTAGLEFALPQREPSEEEIEDMRGMAEDLYRQLKELVPNAPPPTLPDDADKLKALCVQLRQQIGTASVPTKYNGWLGHRFARRTDQSPLVCSGCNQTLAAALGRCKGRPGRY